MRWTRTVFDARAMIGRGTEKPFGFEVPALFLFARLMTSIARGRPKACDPGAAARAMDGRMTKPLRMKRWRNP
jgi:hypothetical protein